MFEAITGPKSMPGTSGGSKGFSPLAAITGGSKNRTTELTDATGTDQGNGPTKGGGGPGIATSYDKKGRPIPTKLVKAPRPQPPWKIVKNEKGHHGHGHHGKGHGHGHGHRKDTKSKLRSALGSMGFEDEDKSSDDSDLPEDNNPKPRKKKYITRTICPFLWFSTGFILLIVFIVQLVLMHEREQGDCRVEGFQKGTDCRECAFEIEVLGLKKKGTYRLAFDDMGVPEVDAFASCPGVPSSSGNDKGSAADINCCDFQTMSEGDESVFCDSGSGSGDGESGWKCHYMLGHNGNPLDIKSGNLVIKMLLLYLGVIFLTIIWPMICLYNLVLDRRYATFVAQGLQASRERLEAVQAQKAMELAIKNGNLDSEGNLIVEGSDK